MGTESTANLEPTVVGIGASAGGLAALKTFLNNVPPDSGLAFVVVVHLAPHHESHFAELLQPHSRFPVTQVSDSTPIEANHVYVIPPNANLSAIDTHLRLTQLEERRQERAPIDYFFRTLAGVHDGNAIAVVLTGTGSDGALGVKDIKAHGGLVVVQDPTEAEYDGMPQSAIATGLVDLILPVAEIPENILRFQRTRPRVPLPEEGEEVPQDERVLVQKVFAQLKARTDRDFSRYKRSTVLRRIARRMQLNYVEDLGKYLDRLRERPDEVRALADDLLITVTHFFRDPEVFDRLANEIPKVFSHKGSQDNIRVWCVGCATGEEAYSIAILLAEEAARHEEHPHVQVFASDLHQPSLEKAREGVYTGDIEGDVTPERLKKFFQRENGAFHIRKEIRDLVIFTPHNVLADPPFSRQDIISCRNLLIYLERDVQHDVIELFHYALNSDGLLLLGSAETIEEVDLFRVEDKKACLFRKRNVPAREPRLPVFPLVRLRRGADMPGRAEPPEPVSYGSMHQQMVERYAPPSILVGPDNRIFHFSEHAGRYLMHPGGEPTASVLKLAREELRIDLQAALQWARDKRTAFDSKPIPVRFNGNARPVVMHVRPSLEPEREGFVLILFEEREPPQEPSGEPSSDTSSRRAEELESELGATRQRLQAVIEEHESSQEEMKASNEEMQSTNEELRSTMEELETSKEELQSINEELQTVNQQNRLKVEELAQMTGDLQNLLTATDIATLFLDRNLRILRFTPKLGELFNVRVSDHGRSIMDLTNRLGYSDLRADAEAVLNRLTPIEREVQDDAGRWYLTRVHPYRSTEDRIEGVVITFVDIESRKQAEERIRQAGLWAETIIDSLHEPILVLSPDLQVRSANPAFYEHFKVEANQTIGRKIYDLGNGQFDLPVLRGLLEEVITRRTVIEDFEIDHEFEGIGRRVILLSARALESVQLILLGLRDITERKRMAEQRAELQSMDRALAAERALRETEAELARVIRALSVGELAASIAHEINQPLAGVVANAQAATRWLGSDPPNVQEASQSLALIARDGNRASDVIRQIRALLRKESRPAQTLDINGVVQEAVALIRGEILKRGVSLECDLADGLPSVKGDRIQLQQVVLNLLMNGMEAMAPAAEKKEIVVKSLKADAESVLVSVRDSGVGIEPGELSRMFEPFFTTKPDGIGLGLALSRSVIETHGGRIWAEKNDGPGLTVEFTLPAGGSDTGQS
jgi:two-component system CheB/CheR fusion protein